MSNEVSIETSQAFLEGGYLAVALVGIAILAVTFGLSIILVKVFRRAYENATNDTAGSIFVMIIRVTVWGVGIFIFLKVCFNFDASVILGALGVGGIALSLGLKDTISNLLAGIQISLLRELSIGDWVETGSISGQVQDINWRRTTILDDVGRTHHVPNSILNSTTLTQMPEWMLLSFPLALDHGADFDVVKPKVEALAKNALVEHSMGFDGKDPYYSLVSANAQGIQTALAIYAKWEYSTAKVRTAVLDPVIAFLAESGYLPKSIEPDGQQRS